MKLEVGKSYLNRNYTLVKIVKYDNINEMYTDHFGVTYQTNGRLFKDKTTKMDIESVFDPIPFIKEITTEDINEAAMDWYIKANREFPSIKTSWNAAIEWYKSQLNQE